MEEKNCLFCQIIKKESPAKIVYEDENVIAFLDIDPVSEGHTLVIPKKHYFSVEDIDNESLSHVSVVAKMIAVKVFNSLGVDGVNILQNNREAADQVIPHYHVHVIPRQKEDGFKVLNVQARIDKDLFSMLDETLSKIKIS